MAKTSQSFEMTCETLKNKICKGKPRTHENVAKAPLACVAGSMGK